jgi:hypothetical protein
MVRIILFFIVVVRGVFPFLPRKGPAKPDPRWRRWEWRIV